MTYRIVRYPPDPYAIGPDTSAPPTVVFETWVYFVANWVLGYMTYQDPHNWYYLVT